MVSTKHCCCGECKTDSRYPDKWTKSLKELQASGKKVFLPFPKLSQDIAKCKRWVVACSRELFTEKNITRNTYICALHWPGEKGPTAEFPDPLKGNLTQAQASQACAPKRKARRSRAEPVTKKEKLHKKTCGEQLLDYCIPTVDRESLESGSTIDAILNKLNESLTNEEGNATPHVYEHSTGKLVSDQGSQTLYSKYELSAKVETMILKNDVATRKSRAPTIVSTLSYENIVRDASLMKHFIGLSPPQFEILHNFLDDVYPLETVNYWTSKDCPATEMQELAQEVIFHQGRSFLFAFWDLGEDLL